MDIFYFPCSDNAAYDHFVKTINQEVTINDLLNGTENVEETVLDEIRNNVGESFRLWGVVPDPKNTPNWGLLNSGDVVVFYHVKKIIGTCKVKYRIQNSAISKNIWGLDKNGNTWEYLVFLEDYIPKNVNSTKTDGSLLMYQGFMKVGPDNKDRVLELIEMEDNASDDEPTAIPPTIPTANTLEDIIDNALINHKQIVLTGAPGTGKTYGATKYVKAKIGTNNNRFEFVQFHPSYDYSDFVEGLRPVVLEGDFSEEPTFVRIDGIFKKFCRHIVMSNYKEQKRRDANTVTFETFKEEYLELEGKNKFQTKYFFVIDEINRADLSKVFGELMYGLEESYRGICHPIKTQYKNLQTHKINENGKGEVLDFDCFEEGFFLPNNLYLIGTMNDIDKSVEAFDFALRRRFEWIEIMAKDVVKSALSEILPSATATQIDELVSKINAMNDVISEEGKIFGLSDSYHIGHAYFKKIDLSDPNSLEKIFNRNIVSILKEYTRGRDIEYVNDFITKCATALGVHYNA